MKQIKPVILSKFGPASLACIRSWGRQGMKVGMVCIQSSKELHPRSRYLTDYVLLHNEDLYNDAGIAIVANFLKTFQADGITCITEKIACWLQDNKYKFPERVSLWVPPKDVILNVLSKGRQIQAAQEANLTVLPTYVIESSNFNPSSIQSSHYPLCLRPSGDGMIKPDFKVKLLASPHALRSFLNLSLIHI